MKANTTQLFQRVLLLVVVAVAVAGSWLAPLDLKANEQVDAGLKRALVTFATARALNAAISAVQGTQVALEPAGVGVIFSPGQVLDPVNDLVEQFSSLMLVASVSFGVQKVVLAIGAYWAVSLMLTISALAWAVVYFREQAAPSWLSRALVILLLTRFAIPLVTIGADAMFNTFMAADYQSSQVGIDSASADLAKFNPSVEAADRNQGMLEKLKGWWSQNGDIKARFENLKAAAEKATERVIKLMAIFVLQTLVIPLVLLWALLGIAKGTFEPRIGMPR